MATQNFINCATQEVLAFFYILNALVFPLKFEFFLFFKKLAAARLHRLGHREPLQRLPCLRHVLKKKIGGQGQAIGATINAKEEAKLFFIFFPFIFFPHVLGFRQKKHAGFL